MRFPSRTFLVALFVFAAAGAPPGRAQTDSQKAEDESSATLKTAHEKNLEAYVEFLRSDVRQQKAEMMGAMMLLSAQDAAKFWPIYSDYDAQLTKLNDQRVENIKEYAGTYNDMTDERADVLIQKAMTYQKQREELLTSTYDKVKQALGAITAARFIQIEHQLLSLIDLQIDSSLPIVGPGS